MSDEATTELWRKVEAIVSEARTTALGTAKTDPSNDYSAPLPPPCEGCGGIAHGGVVAGELCLKRALIAARVERDVARAQRDAARAERDAYEMVAAPILRLRAQVAALPFDPASNRNVSPLPSP